MREGEREMVVGHSVKIWPKIGVPSLQGTCSFHCTHSLHKPFISLECSLMNSPLCSSSSSLTQATAMSPLKAGGTTAKSIPSGAPATPSRLTWWASPGSTRSELLMRDGNAFIDTPSN